METSFKPVNMANVPQNPNDTNGDTSYSYKNREENSGGGFQIIIIFITVIMFLFAGGVFAWQGILNSSIADKKKLLDTKQSDIANFQLNENGKMSSKFHTVKYLIDGHPFVSDIFKILEYSIVPGIVYNKFDTHSDAASGDYYVEVSGVSPDYHTLINQIDVLKNKEEYLTYFSSTDVSDFKPNSKGSIDFSFKIKSNIKGASHFSVDNDLQKSLANPAGVISGDATTTDVVTATTTPVTNVTLKQNIKPVTKVQSKAKTLNAPDMSGI